MNLMRSTPNLMAAAAHDPGALHPLVVHFPIALLLVAPLFLILGLLFSRAAKTFFVASLLLLGLGTCGLFYSISTGKAASGHVNAGQDTLDTLEIHMRLAEQSRLLFSILTVLFLFYILWIHFGKQNPRTTYNILFLLLFLGFYFYAALILYNAAHQGGKLVHHFGIRSTLYK